MAQCVICVCNCPLCAPTQVNECHWLTSSSVLALAAACPLLLSVNMRGTRITDDALEALASKCPLLADLNLECCLAITDVGIEALGRGAVRAQLGNNDGGGSRRSGAASGGSGGNGIHVATGGAGLQLANSSSSTGSGTGLGNNNSNEIGGRRDLNNLALARRFGPAAWASANSNGFNGVLPTMAEEIDDENGTADGYGDDNGVGAPTLRSFSVSGCVRITDQSIVSVAAACRRLAHVDLSQVRHLAT